MSIDSVCKLIIELYPESEMEIAFYAMGILWDAAYSEEAPDFNEAGFLNYLKKLYSRQNARKIYGYAGLILSAYEIAETDSRLDKIICKYNFRKIKELASFYKFTHQFVYKGNNQKARRVVNKMDNLFPKSKYAYQAHIMLDDEGYTLEGLKALIDSVNAGLGKYGAKYAQEMIEQPVEYKLYNNYPNPFNPATTIKYSLAENSLVTLKVYNTMGQLVKTLVNKHQSEGSHSVEWDGTNDGGVRVTSGVYIYRISAGNFNAVNKMILLK